MVRQFPSFSGLNNSCFILRISVFHLSKVSWDRCTPPGPERAHVLLAIGDKSNQKHLADKPQCSPSSLLVLFSNSSSNILGQFPCPLVWHCEIPSLLITSPSCDPLILPIRMYRPLSFLVLFLLYSRTPPHQ